MKINFDKSELLKNPKLKLISIELEHLVINQDKRVYVVLKDNSDRKNAVEINNYEGSMLTFVHKGLYKNSHINTIHQLFLKTLERSSSKVTEVVIESKVGDIIYCSLKIIDAKLNEYFSIITLSDGLILHRITNCKLYCLENVWDDMDELDDWDYEDYILDLDPDED